VRKHSSNHCTHGASVPSTSSSVSEDDDVDEASTLQTQQLQSRLLLVQYHEMLARGSAGHVVVQRLAQPETYSMIVVMNTLVLTDLTRLSHAMRNWLLTPGVKLADSSALLAVELDTRSHARNREENPKMGAVRGGCFSAVYSYRNGWTEQSQHHSPLTLLNHDAAQYCHPVTKDPDLR
jgi:hypothetical protein